MKRTLFLLLLPAFFWSCNYRIFTNGQYSHKENGLTEKGLSRCDSCLVFEPFETMPDSMAPICQTTIFSPYFWMVSPPVEYPMIDRARSEAAKAGANVIWICDKQDMYKQKGSQFFKRLKFETRLYSLQEPYKSVYVRRQDSLKKERASLCIVHIKSYTWDDCPIYWNDTCVGHCDGLSRSNGPAKSCDLVFSSAGFLSCQNKPRHTAWDTLNLEQGKEYFVIIRLVKSGLWIGNIDRHRW